MLDIKKQCDDLFARLRKYFVGTDKLESRDKITKKKWLNLGLVVLGAFIAFIVLLLFIASNSKKQSEQSEGGDLTSIASADNTGSNTDLASKHQKIELGTDATKGEVKWQNFLEESIEKEGNLNTLY